MKLIGTTKNAVDNENQLINTIYNLTGQVNLIDTTYLTLNTTKNVNCLSLR
ncbi:hypothetical protein [Methanobrevibacter sp. V74]|uniref:hypothetical protein n=1 Tax=Methanobrevibacter sp. V74 TaxID=3064279 RepID=UPI00273584DD|nr:hypothetical protein [Methanobrevibacter sp. V74]